MAIRSMDRDEQKLDDTAQRVPVRRRIGIRRAAAAITLTVASVAAVAIGAGPAAADGSYTGQAYFRGSGGLVDDWDDEGVVNVSTHRVSNVACLWQQVLSADGYLDLREVDGIFGDRTHAATVRWQRDRGLTPDGSVGRLSWAKAGNNLQDLGTDTSGYRTGHYNGSSSGKSLRRNTAGVHQFWDSDGGVYRTVSYNSRTCR
jgi:hypothetical protein